MAVSFSAALAPFTLGSELSHVSSSELVEIGSARGIRGDVALPVVERWSVYVHADLSRLEVERQILGPPPAFDVIEVRDDPAIHVGQAGAGVMRRRASGRRVCPYVALGGGWYRVSCADSSGNGLGVAGLVGFDVLLGKSYAVAMQFHLDVIITGLEPRLTAGGRECSVRC